MINYYSWKEKFINVTKLKLDANNPRLSHFHNNITQNDLINAMINHYKIYELAKSIAEDGFFPDKNLIVVFENDNHIVVEGNRRLAALKALLTPEIVNEKFRNKFKKLNSIIEESFIQKVKVIIAPSREAANPIIFKEHTERTSMPWSRIMQAEFYMKQLRDYSSIDELASRYNLTKSEITKFLRLLNMYNIACSLNFENEDVKNKVIDKQSFNASVLERVYESQLMRDFLLFDFDEQGNIHGKTDKNEFSRAYGKIIEDIVTGSINTRILNDQKNFLEYINKLEKYKPQSSGSFSQSDFYAEDVVVEQDTTKEPKKKRTSPQTSAIIPPGIPFTLKGATNLKKFYSELRKLSVKSYPNSVSAMLRVFLDKSIRMYLKKKQIKRFEIIENGNKIKKKIEDLSLGEIIDQIVKKDSDVLSDNTKKILRQFKSASDKASLNALNSIMHNEEYSLHDFEVRQIWTKLEPVFREILQEP